MIFGSTNSPSYYMLSGDLRSWLSSIRDYGQARVQVMDSAVLPPAPSTQQIAQFRPAFPNVFNHGAASMLEHSASALYPVFVNDTGNAHICSHIILTVMASVLSTYIIFGFPGGNPWANCPPPCINENKWSNHLSHHVTFLGYEIDTRQLTIMWPFEKWCHLHDRISEILQAFRLLVMFILNFWLRHWDSCRMAVLSFPWVPPFPFGYNTPSTIG